MVREESVDVAFLSETDKQGTNIKETSYTATAAVQHERQPGRAGLHHIYIEERPFSAQNTPKQALFINSLVQPRDSHAYHTKHKKQLKDNLHILCRRTPVAHSYLFRFSKHFGKNIWLLRSLLSKLQLIMY